LIPSQAPTLKLNFETFAFPPAKLGNLEKRRARARARARARHFLKLQIQAKKFDIENDSNGDFTPIKKLWVEIFLPVRFPKTPRRQLQH